jgi:hypothetical protein
MKVKYLHIRFGNALMPFDIVNFRKAVTKVSGESSNLFHNHDDVNKVIYRYPLIQYKTFRKCASILTLQEGAEVVHHLFQKGIQNINMGQWNDAPYIQDMVALSYQVAIWNNKRVYQIRNWLAFSSENFKVYQKIPYQSERIEFLEKILLGNVISFAGGINWTVEKEISLKIREIQEERWITYKGVKMLAFSLQFDTNVSMPDFIGLGRGVSVGFGVINENLVENDS